MVIFMLIDIKSIIIHRLHIRHVNVRYPLWVHWSNSCLICEIGQEFFITFSISAFLLPKFP